jgi:hypothetical protein
MGRTLAVLLVALLGLAFAAPSFAHAQDPDGSPAATPKNLAPKEVADQATETLTTFVKRASSTNPEVRHRAWEMLTPNAQANLFFGQEAVFYFVAGEILQLGDVTIEEENVGIEAAIKGLWNPHDFTNSFFLLTSDATLIDDGRIELDHVTVPEGLSSTKVTVQVKASAISTRSKPLATKDVVIVTFVNEDSAVHNLGMYRLAEGQTEEELLDLVATGQAYPSQYARVRLAPGEIQMYAVMDVTPGSYIFTGVPGGGQGAETESLVDVVATLTVIA